MTTRWLLITFFVMTVAGGWQYNKGEFTATEAVSSG